MQMRVFWQPIGLWGFAYWVVTERICADSATWISMSNMKHLLVRVKVEIQLCFYFYKTFWCFLIKIIYLPIGFIITGAACRTLLSNTSRSWESCPAHFAELSRNWWGWRRQLHETKQFGLGFWRLFTSFHTKALRKIYSMTKIWCKSEKYAQTLLLTGALYRFLESVSYHFDVIGDIFTK